MKLDSGDNTNIQITTNVTSRNTWATLSFDFSIIGGYGNYSRLTVLIDIGNDASGTFLIDDISDG
ncbi:MAG: hypothetical protein ACO3VF_08230 [Tamlana sp.]